METEDLKTKMLVKIAFTLATLNVGFAAWATGQIYGRPTHEQVSLKIKSEAPYVEDRKEIQTQLKIQTVSHDKLANAIDRNTEVLKKLELRIASQGPVRRGP